MSADEADPITRLTRGERVVVRHRLATPDPGTGATLTDVVGDLIEVDGESLLVRTRRGDVRVVRASVTTAKVVPPPPSRRGAPHRALSVEDLERVKLPAWPAPETTALGEWVLRSGGGLTHRANSVLAVGSPGLELGAAIDHVEAWYSRRGLRPDVALPGHLAFSLDHDALGAELLSRGWVQAVRSVTMTAAVAECRTRATALASPQGVDGIRLEVTTTPPAGWLDLFVARRGGDAELARAILTGSPQQWFATAHDAGTGAPVGRARLALASGWAGISAVEVAPSHRRRGLGRALAQALLPHARDVGSVHLDVEVDNAAARSLYASLGFVDHHEYVNLVAPQGD